jgi:hypothetical protein
MRKVHLWHKTLFLRVSLTQKKWFTPKIMLMHKFYAKDTFTRKISTQKFSTRKILTQKISYRFTRKISTQKFSTNLRIRLRVNGPNRSKMKQKIDHNQKYQDSCDLSSKPSSVQDYKAKIKLQRVYKYHCLTQSVQTKSYTTTQPNKHHHQTTILIPLRFEHKLQRLNRSQSHGIWYLI